MCVKRLFPMSARSGRHRPRIGVRRDHGLDARLAANHSGLQFLASGADAARVTLTFHRGPMPKKRATKKAAHVKPAKRARAAKKVSDALVATVRGATHRYIGHVRLDVGRAGAARVKRMIYPP